MVTATSAAIVAGLTGRTGPIVFSPLPVSARLRWAGAASGFAAGSIGALVYTLHCPELAAPFLGIWYLLGMLIPTAIGAWLGPRLLRW